MVDIMLQKIQKSSTLLIGYILIMSAMILLNFKGAFMTPLASDTWLKLSIYYFVIGHLTIVSMSLSFHRYHTHKGVLMTKWIDYPMQTLLWAITSMSKLDWVTVHQYHHAHSDQHKDPHSPVMKGLLRVFFLGVYDYAKAKNSTEVLALRKYVKMDRYEKFIHQNQMLAPIILTVILILLFGPLYGSLISILNFSISPLLAVGGVNALAHKFGYKNHVTTDNSRNLGFIFPVNFLISGELDHNNHHAKASSCKFAHRWFEFDIGYLYLKMLSSLGLARILIA